jgi:predicted enzyme related to lactoylglutathione lyase
MAEEPKNDPTGQVCWLEIPVADVARAKKFYAGVFGWDVDGASMPSAAVGSSTIHFFSKGQLHGAFHIMDEGCHLFNVDTQDPRKLAVLATLCVADVEETMKKAGELGGKTHV